jgi:glucose/arabinose dehydrogenase
MYEVLEDKMFRRFSMTLVAVLVASQAVAAPYYTIKRSTTPAKGRTTTSQPTQQTAPAQPAPAPAPAPTFGTFFLSATQNGFPTNAQFQLLASDGSVVFSGASGVAHTVPTGTFIVKALSNGATFTSSVVINKDLTTESAATFTTGRISLSITSDTGSTAGIAKIYSAGVEVGSIGSGNQITLPAGTYDVKVLHSGTEKWFYGVALSQNQLRNVAARF